QQFIAKNIGTTKVTMKYKGEKCSCKIEVVEEGTFKSTKVIEKAKEELEEILQIIPSKVTIKNGFSLLEAILRYENIIYNQCYSQINHFGFLMENTEDGDEKTQSCKLAIPQAGRYGYLENLLSRYREKHLSLNTRDENAFKIKSVAATANELTIKLKEEISAKQMLAAQITQCQMCSLYTPLEEERATLHLHIEDEETDDSFVCLAAIEKNSKTIIAIPVVFDYDKPKISYTRIELLKGHTYILGEKMQWTKGMKFKVK
ncbi:MAG: hypothetical protein J6A75_07845, partial [Lachnospiraceae bacterium]|nr:hypothetical protein [Lachnospiraceae bacterium]